MATHINLKVLCYLFNIIHEGAGITCDIYIYSSVFFFSICYQIVFANKRLSRTLKKQAHVIPFSLLTKKPS